MVKCTITSDNQQEAIQIGILYLTGIIVKTVYINYNIVFHKRI